MSDEAAAADQAGSAEADDQAARNLQERLMASGHERPEGDRCPICLDLIELSMDEHARINVCCTKRVCKGCILATRKRGMWDCPFCRAPIPRQEQSSEILARVQKRVDAGDPMAIWHLGNKYRYGRSGLEKDMTRAVELYERAAELGVKEAHYCLGFLYSKGKDVEKDTAKAIRHYEVAAMLGDVDARYSLGHGEGRAENHDLALQHYLMAAKMGHQNALNAVKGLFTHRYATKADYAAALRGYQSATEQTRSPDRDEAKQ